MKINHIYQGNCLEILNQINSNSVDCCITSPPYWGLRDYGVEGQLGLENTPEEYVANMVKLFSEVKRVLKNEGTLWLNLGDSYYNYRPGAGQSIVKQTCSNTIQDLPQICARRANIIEGLKEKDLVGIPWRVAFALQADGWYLRQDIIWHKPNPMPESVADRCTKSHEYIFLLSKNPKYYFDNGAIKEDAKEGLDMGILRSKKQAITGKRNKRSVWTVNTKPFREAHFATFPEGLITPMVKAGCPKKGIVLDPFMGAGTTAVVSKKLDRNYIGVELNPKYIAIAEKRIENECGNLF